MKPMVELRAENLRKVFKQGYLRYTGKTVVKSLNLTVSEGSGIIALAGESGSGKSTVALMLLGLLQPTSGAVIYNGQNINALSAPGKKEFRRNVQAVLQDPFASFNPFYSVDRFLMVPLEKFKIGRTRAEKKEIISRSLFDIGINPDEVLGRYPHQLSGGQRQRLAIARALSVQPKVLIADEPVSMVDASLRATILASLKKMNRDFNIPILYITHDLITAYHVCDYLVIMKDGEVVEEGSPEAVIKSPAHPYTKLLVDSIPWPDLNRCWKI